MPAPGKAPPPRAGGGSGAEALDPSTKQRLQAPAGWTAAAVAAAAGVGGAHCSGGMSASVDGLRVKERRAAAPCQADGELISEESSVTQSLIWGLPPGSCQQPQHGSLAGQPGAPRNDPSPSERLCFRTLGF